MNGSFIKKSFRLAGHATSVALEPEFWAALQKLAAQRKTTLSALVAGVDSQRQGRNLASALRVFVLKQAEF